MLSLGNAVHLFRMAGGADTRSMGGRADDPRHLFEGSDFAVGIWWQLWLRPPPCSCFFQVKVTRLPAGFGSFSQAEVIT